MPDEILENRKQLNPVVRSAFVSSMSEHLPIMQILPGSSTFDLSVDPFQSLSCLLNYKLQMYRHLTNRVHCSLVKTKTWTGKR